MAPRKTLRLPATITFRIDPKTRKTLQKIADDRHMSEGALVLHLVTEGLGRYDTVVRLDDVEARLVLLESIVLEPKGEDASAQEESPAEPSGN